ncbi:hypothetical protein CQ12_21445 [Bradyrhizobium jicamae]|uniref:Uncharacterized protein n=1 Tax=Bradyrhizobium jicamae TaxID=280332 RepID=A0A0R3M0A3_9BRAD|nr:hypothetical protein [Bradyrhizobium jicamae]KRR10835.1 hypothetical protein CQ12_21445 [Bradyrhizobium jicamae]
MSNIQEIHVGEGIQPLTVREKFEEQFPHIGPIHADEDRLESENQSNYEAHQRALNAYRLEVAENAHMLMVEQRSPKRSTKREERLEKEAEKLKAKRAEIDRRQNEYLRNRPGPMGNAIRSFFSSSAAHQPYECANTTDTLLPGKTAVDMTQHYREQNQAKLAERIAIGKAPLPAAEIQAIIAEDVSKWAAKIQKSVRHVDLNDKTDRFKRRSLSLPRLSIPDGIGGITYVPDALGVMAALFGPEMIERLTALILENHNDADALDAVERSRRLKEVNAAILDIQYKGEYWHRVARSQGANPGPRISTNVLAILDLVRA